MEIINVEDVMKYIVDTYEIRYNEIVKEHQNEGKIQDKPRLFDTEYRDISISIMEQAREMFLAAFKDSGYKKGAATGILSDILNENTSFVVCKICSISLYRNKFLCYNSVDDLALAGMDYYRNKRETAERLL